MHRNVHSNVHRGCAGLTVQLAHASDHLNGTAGTGLLIMPAKVHYLSADLYVQQSYLIE